MAVPVMAAQEAGKQITGLMQHVSAAATFPVIRVRVQPGHYRRDKKSHVRTFVPNPMYPDGVSLSFPAWLVLIVGLEVMSYGMTGLTKLMSGLGVSKKEHSALGLIADKWSRSWSLGGILGGDAGGAWTDIAKLGSPLLTLLG